MGARHNYERLPASHEAIILGGDPELPWIMGKAAADSSQLLRRRPALRPGQRAGTCVHGEVALVRPEKCGNPTAGSGRPKSRGRRAQAASHP